MAGSEGKFYALSVMSFRNVRRVIANGATNFPRLSSSTRALTNAEVRAKRNTIYDEEKKRQLALLTRIEKIKVVHRGPPEECTLIMNKGLSTPFNCAMHIQELLMTRSVLALVNEKPWDMHRPLTEDCVLQFLHFKDENSSLVNRTFWKSCSFILGHVLETAFKDEYYVELCSFPPPNVKSGSFVYDADLKLLDWKPSEVELNCLSRIGMSLQNQDLRFERLVVDASAALKMFADNKFKVKQIPEIAAKSETGSLVTVYRLGEHTDISQGPMIATSGLLGRYTVTAIHDIESPEFGPLQRVQGLALPSQLWLHYWTYEYLQNQAKQLNSAPAPRLIQKQLLTKSPAAYKPLPDF